MKHVVHIEELNFREAGNLNIDSFSWSSRNQSDVTAIHSLSTQVQEDVTRTHLSASPILVNQWYHV